MQSIDTLYNGNYFRSRLEARWAYFFDSVGLTYEYEPQGFSNKGERYLPDFFLPGCYIRSTKTGVYVEIKPESYPHTDIPKASWFELPLILFKGTPDKCLFGGYDVNGYQCGRGWDSNMGIWKCPLCSAFKIEFHEGSYDNCPCGHSVSNDYTFLKKWAQESILKRFEHQF